MPSRPRTRLKLVVIALALVYSGLSKADDINIVGNNIFFPLYPRLNVTGAMGDNNYGNADVMIPLLGSTSAIFYTDLEGQTGKGKSNFLSLGLGGRDAINDDVMWGGYAFIDRSKANDSDGGNHWTVLNPGVEFMTNNWDGRINGYIPTGDEENVRGPFFGDQVGRPDAESFTDHDQFSRLFNKVDEIGPGLDVDAGYTFTSLKRFRVHAGGYHFSLSDTGNITGGEAGVEMPVNNYFTLKFDDSYDDVQKNTAVVGLRFTLGGIDKYAADPTVQDRILDPVYRHFGALRTNTGIPSNNGLVEIAGLPVLEQNNIWFYDANGGTAFNPSAGLNNCTFQHPCKGTDFNQNNINFINSIDGNANFYFKPGMYTFDAPTNTLNLNSGQSMYGRNDDYTLAASSANGGFPTFIGELDPQGNNRLDSFALINNNGSQTIGIHVSNANNILMNNLQIGQANSPDSYKNSIQLDNANNVTIQNSVIKSVNADYGLFATNSSNVNLNTNDFTLSGGTSMFGIWDTSSTITATKNTFTLSNPGSGTIGVNNDTNGTITLVDNVFNINSTIPTTAVSAAFVNSGPGIINARHNTVTINTTGSVFGVSNNGTGTINLDDNNVFSLTSTNGGTVFGVFNGSGATTNLNNTTFTLDSSGSMIGIFKTGLGPVIGSNNTFNFTGAGTKTCGDPSFFSSNGNIYTGTGVIC